MRNAASYVDIKAGSTDASEALDFVVAVLHCLSDYDAQGKGASRPVALQATGRRCKEKECASSLIFSVDMRAAGFNGSRSA